MMLARLAHQHGFKSRIDIEPTACAQRDAERLLAETDIVSFSPALALRRRRRGALHLLPPANCSTMVRTRSSSPAAAAAGWPDARRRLSIPAFRWRWLTPRGSAICSPHHRRHDSRLPLAGARCACAAAAISVTADGRDASAHGQRSRIFKGQVANMDKIVPTVSIGELKIQAG
ncbi:MAG: hypothetical protein R2911_26030 [Caldilineaceae bacterium]